MGRLFLSRLGFICFMLLLFSNMAIAQNSFYIFKKSGQPFFNVDLPVQRGAVFRKSDTLTLRKLDTVFLINRLGELFELKEPRGYSYNSLQNFRKKSENESFTSKYFSYVWRQFTNKQESRQQPGVVYREDRNIKLTEPMDSIKWYVPEINFSWENRTDSLTTYFHLQDLDTNHITKLGTTSNSLILYKDNLILKPGKSYRWAVTTSPFPDFNEIKFNNFELLTKESHSELKKEMEALILALKILGFSEDDIKKAICLDYKFCE
ncbi:hypothetical protein [Maribacter sp. Asnod2-G09]|uniref:hypothetical protein n=1 Tax=Maribacter sp. Asnod2-G09 TaxID=3160577 RepID=UPI0038650B3E